ncbi:MAG TPA: hypothetical protein VMT52_19130 [Planctomycetota bacterium]|nr:hypothetical protein [Planctomycetota bacterium]
MSPPQLRDTLLLVFTVFVCVPTRSLALPTALSGDLTVVHVLDTGRQMSMRIDRDPVTGDLHYLRTSGSIYRVTLAPGGATSERVHTSSDTGIASPQGFAFGPDGAIYIVGNQASGATTTATIRRGTRIAGAGDAREWATLASTAPYPLGGDLFNHLFNGIAVSPDGLFVYVNSGSRTDHGEVADHGGAYPGLREVPVTSNIFRLPSDGIDLLLENDEAALRGAGYLFAQGLRNSFDLAFAANGDLFATENSGDRDDSEELNWIREGHHYGFPWRMGTNDTPQRAAGYDPDSDPLIDHEYYAWQHGLFHDDPTYPPPPAGVTFTDPVLNEGPDADMFRDPATGEIRDASALGVTVGTFTAHRSPLGLVFDAENALGGEYQGKGFVLGWTRGDPAGDAGQGPFKDPGQDLLLVDLTRSGDSYRARVTRIAGGFANPVDAVLAGTKLYVLEHGGQGGIWEVSFPAAEPAARFRRGFVNGDESADITDAVSVLLHLFAGLTIACLDAADTNGDARRDVSDAVYLLNFLFVGGPAPPAPFDSCGPADSLDAACQPAAPCS